MTSVLCWLAAHGVHERGPMPPCEGRLIRAHLIPRRVFLRECDPVTAAKAIDDPRSYVYACGGVMGNAGHHGMADWSRTLRIPYENLPGGLLELAAECGLEWYIEREYGDARRAA